MNNQLSRIASFIDSLGDDNVLGNESSFLLSTDMNAIGGNNGLNCENTTTDSCKGVKNGGDYKNYYNTCHKADNKGNCSNTGIDELRPINSTTNC